MTLFSRMGVDDPPAGGLGLSTQLLWQPAVAASVSAHAKSLWTKRTAAEVGSSAALESVSVHFSDGNSSTHESVLAAAGIQRTS
jgi:hypothetical protein